MRVLVDPREAFVLEPFIALWGRTLEMPARPAHRDRVTSGQVEQSTPNNSRPGFETFEGPAAGLGQLGSDVPQEVEDNIGHRTQAIEHCHDLVQEQKPKA